MQEPITERRRKTLIGKPVRRKEDARLITGRANYVDDFRLPGMLYAAILRSPYGHAKVERIDYSKAIECPSVATAVSINEILRMSKPKITKMVPLREGALEGAKLPDFWNGKVRYQGDPVMAIAAEDRYTAEDALDIVEVDYSPLPAVTDVEKAARAHGLVVNPELGSNIALTWVVNAGNLEKAFKEADRVIKERFRIQRVAASPIENRCMIAYYDRIESSLTVWISTQAAHLYRTDLADLLGIPEHKIRVVAPDVGGGFGSKLQVMRDEMLVILLSMKTGRPVKWVESRTENLEVLGHEREQVHYVEWAVRNDGTILGAKHRFFADIGAYPQTWTFGPPSVTMMQLPGAYRIRNFHAELYYVYTNKAPLAAYRGFGAPQAYFVVERMVDIVARELGLDPAEVRLRNFVKREEVPWTSVTGYTYDSGDYPLCLRKALDAIDYLGFRQEQTKLRKEGRYVGIGMAFFIEGAGWAPSRAVPSWGGDIGGYETATVRADPSGKITVLTGVSSQGQGQETSLAQIAADELQLDLEDVRVVSGDTSAVPYGIGTFSSRSAAVGGAAVLLATRKLREKATLIAAHMMKTSLEQVELVDGAFRCTEKPSMMVTFADVSRAAFKAHDLPDGIEPGLEASGVFDPTNMTFSYGVHIPIVEVDPETGKVRFLRYYVLHDTGTIINPTIVEGQMHGATIQGLACTLLEELTYDESGQLLSTNFMNYLIPTAHETCDIEVDHMTTLAPHIPTGAKGSGEGGTIPSPGAITNAIEDALTPFNVKITETPVTPERLRNLIQSQRSR